METITQLLCNLHPKDCSNLPNYHTLKRFQLIFNIINDVSYIFVLANESLVNKQA